MKKKPAHGVGKQKENLDVDNGDNVQEGDNDVSDGNDNDVHGGDTDHVHDADDSTDCDNRNGDVVDGFMMAMLTIVMVMM